MRSAKQAEDGKNSDPVVEEPSRSIKELESKLGEHEKEKVRPKLSEEAVETLLSEEGVSKGMEKLGPTLVRLFKEPQGPERLKPIRFITNDAKVEGYAAQSWAAVGYNWIFNGRGNSIRMSR